MEDFEPQVDQPQPKLSAQQFAAKVKAKYPEYKDIDDNLLAQKMVEKYPEYKEQVSFEPLKKKEPSQSLGGVSQPKKYESAITPFQEGMAKLQPEVSKKPTPQSSQFLAIGEEAPQYGTKPQQVEANSDTNLPDIKKAIDATVESRIKAKRGVYDRTLPKPTKEELSRETEAVTNLYKQGELVPQLDSKGNSVMKRGGGFLTSLKDAMDFTHKQELENQYVVNLPKEEAITFLNNRRNHPDIVPQRETAPSGVGGKIGEFVGENLPFLSKATAGTVAGAQTGATGGASIGSFMAIANDLANSGYATTLERNYNLLKNQNPGMSDEEAYNKSHEAALIGEAVSLGTGAILSGQLPFGRTPKPTVPITGVVDGLVKTAKHSLKSAPKVVGSSAAGSVINDIVSNLEGAKVSGKEMEANATEHAKQMAIMHFGLAALTLPAQIPSFVRPQVENVVASAPREQVKEFYNEMEQRGAIPEGTTDKVLSKLTEFTDQKKVLEGMPLNEEQKASITGKLLQRKKLQEENKSLKNYGGSFNARVENNDKSIESLDTEIRGIIDTGDVSRFEKDKVTGESMYEPKPHESLTKQEREGIVVPKEYGEAVVTEKGEGENKTYTPQASFTVKEGGLEKSVKIKMDDEGKTYKSKEQAQKAADEALAKHFYENKMPDYDKPEAKESKIQQPAKTESPTVEEPNSAIEKSEGDPITQIDEKEVVRQMRPFTDKMVQIENKFSEKGYEINTDYDNEITVTKNGELVEPDELPTELRGLASQYESATIKLGEFSDTSREKALKQSRKTEDTTVEEVNPVEQKTKEQGSNTLSEVEKIPFEDRTDKQHSDFIKQKFVKEFTEKGVPKEQVDAALALMEARAKASGSEYTWYRQIQDIGKGEFKSENVNFQTNEGDIKLPKNGVFNLFHSTTNPISGEFRVVGKNNSWGIFFSRTKKYSQTFGDITYKAKIQPKKTLILKDNEVAKKPFFNINENQYNEYIKEGYDSISWYKNGELQEFIVLNPKIIKGTDVLYQNNKGAVETLANGRKIIHALDAPDFSTAVHEIAHIFEGEISEAEKKVIQDWAVTKEWNTKTSETFARGFERYLRDGNAPTPELKTIFQKAKEWMQTIYQKLAGSPIAKKITPEVKEVFDNLFKEQSKTESNGQRQEGRQDVLTNPEQTESTGGNPPPEPPVTETTPTPKEPRFNDKSILKRLTESENIRPETREKFKDNLKYKVKSQEEARTVAKEIIKEYDIDEAVTLAESGKFHGDVNSMIFGEALDNLYRQEQEAKTPQEKLALAERWADVSMRYDEAARSGGRFISAIADFYKKSPLGIRLKEEANRNEVFKEWFKNKETNYKDVFQELIKEPEFKDLIKEEVQTELKKERAEYREKRRKNIEDFFDKAKFKGDATYATIIPPKVINGGIEAMKQAFLAGESVVAAVEKAIDHISAEIKDWDKDKFRKEWEEKLRKMDGAKKSKLTDEELTEQKKERLLDRFRKKLKGLSEKEKEEVIRKSFKKLVENGALEYEDFKDIIKQTLGLGELTQDQKNNIDQYVKDINAVEDAAEKARTERTDKSLSEFHATAKKAEKSATKLGEIVYNKPNILRRFLSIMQLNTLGIPSLVNNPIFNIFNQAFVRFPKSIQLSIIDKLIQGTGKVFGKDWKPNNNVVSAQVPFFKGVSDGAKQSIEQAVTGLTNKDYFQKEVYTSQIHPITSAKELWDFAKGDIRLTKAQAVDKGLQATIGLPAEAVARMLNIGDKPQRFATERAAAKVIADKYGLKGMDEKLFMEFPKKEAYRLEKAKGESDEAAMKKAEEIERKIIEEGEESTFQQDNIVSDMLASMGQAYDKMADGKAPLEFVGKAGSIFKTMNLPFLKIPLNAYWSYFNLVNPEIAAGQSFIYGVAAAYKKAKGIDGWQRDFEQSKKWLTHATTGMAMLAVTGMLAKNGIIRGDNSSKDTKKEREGERNYEQQHSLNMGKLQAFLSGKDPNEVTDGLNVDLKWFGVVGNAMNLQADNIENMTPEQKKNGMTLVEDALTNLKNSALELSENGVFSNASGLLSAINSGGSFADAYFMNLVNMGTNVVNPAMFSQTSRASLPYEYTTKADSFWEELKNNMAARSSVVRELSGHYPPAKVGIWGDRLDRPNNWALRWFSMSPYKKDNFAQPIYEDYKKTGNTKFFPSSVKPEVNDQKLNVEQTRHLEQLVGQSRKELVAPYVNGYATLPLFADKKYSELSTEDKIKALEILYKQGYDNGVAKFEALYPQFKKKEKTWDEEQREDDKKAAAEELRERIKQ